MNININVKGNYACLSGLITLSTISNVTALIRSVSKNYAKEIHSFISDIV